MKNENNIESLKPKKKKKHNRQLFLAGIITILLIASLVLIKKITSVWSLNYDTQISELEIQSDDWEAAGSWKLDINGKWTSTKNIKVTYNLDTKIKSKNEDSDIIFVINNSFSMEDNKIIPLKDSLREVINSLLVNENNKVALITFNDTANIISDFTSDSNALNNIIDEIEVTGSTNYNNALLKVNEIISDYEKEENRNIKVVFITDGYPTAGTPNDAATYRIMKAKYPYISVNAIQYEMGNTIVDDIKNISDIQLVATTGNINNVLLSAVDNAIVYDNFTINEYIDGNYFKLNDLTDINVSIGNVNLEVENGVQKIVWQLSDNSFKSGMKASMTVALSLINDEYAENVGFYPVSSNRRVVTKLGNSSETVNEYSDTLVFTNKYKVRYVLNTPSGCNLGVNIDDEDFFVDRNVEKKNMNLSCSGYVFKGFEVINDDVTEINQDVFVMPSHDVNIGGVWTKQSLTKTMDGTVYVVPPAIFDNGSVVNAKMKNLANGTTDMTYSSADTKIKKFLRGTSLPSSFVAKEANTVSSSGSKMPIYIWFSSGTLYYYTDAEVININIGASFFRNLTALTDVTGLRDIDTSNLTSLAYFFDKCGSLTSLSPLADWDVSKVISMQNAFSECSSLTSLSALSNWNVTSKLTNLRDVFWKCSGLTSLTGIENWDTSKVTTLWYAFDLCTGLKNLNAISNWNTSSVLNMQAAFYKCSSLTSLSGLLNWDTSKVEDMSLIFQGCTALTNLTGLENWNTSKVTTMASAFRDCNSLTSISKLSKWNTASVENLSSTFQGCTALTSLSGLNGTNWNTSKVTTLDNTFNDCESVTSLSPLANWNVGNVTSMVSTFNRCMALTALTGLNNWTTSKVTSMDHTFWKCTGIKNLSAISGWNTTNVTTMAYMFSQCNALTTGAGINSWNVKKVTSFDRMFYSCPALTTYPTFTSRAGTWNTTTGTFTPNS